MKDIELLEKAEKNKGKLSPKARLVTEALRTYLNGDNLCKMEE